MKELNESVIKFLESLEGNINPRTLSYPLDYKMIMDGFKKLIESKTYFHEDEMEEYLLFRQKELGWSEIVIDHICKMAFYSKIAYVPLSKL